MEGTIAKRPFAQPDRPPPDVGRHPIARAKAMLGLLELPGRVAGEDAIPNLRVKFVHGRHGGAKKIHEQRFFKLDGEVPTCTQGGMAPIGFGEKSVPRRRPVEGVPQGVDGLDGSGLSQVRQVFAHARFQVSGFPTGGLTLLLRRRACVRMDRQGGMKAFGGFPRPAFGESSRGSDGFGRLGHGKGVARE